MISVDRNSLSRHKTRWIGFRWTHHIIFYFNFLFCVPKVTFFFTLAALYSRCQIHGAYLLNLYHKKIKSLANLCIRLMCISRFEVRDFVVVVVVRCQKGKNITHRYQSIKSISFYSLCELQNKPVKIIMRHGKRIDIHNRFLAHMVFFSVFVFCFCFIDDWSMWSKWSVNWNDIQFQNNLSRNFYYIDDLVF